MTLSPRDRRAVVIGSGIVLGVLLVTRLIPAAVRSVVALRDRAMEAAATASRAREALAGAPVVRDSLGQAAAEIIALATKLTDGGTAAEAQASLSSLVSLIASRQALRLVRLDPLPDSTLGPFGQVAVHAELEGDVRGLAAFLQAVEAGGPLLSVSSLGVSAPDPSDHPSTAEVLRIEARVEGLYLRRGL